MVRSGRRRWPWRSTSGQVGASTTLKEVCGRYVSLDFDNATQPGASATLCRNLYKESCHLRAQEYHLTRVFPPLMNVSPSTLQLDRRVHGGFWTT